MAKVTVGELVAAFLEQCGVKTAFGVISIHNMPILDAFHRRGKLRFVPARGEAGGGSMADAYARALPGLGVLITSTGTAAGNACGALVEAQTAGTPLLHLTGQVELPYIDRDLAYIHEAHDQPTMLRGASKQFYRIWSADTALAVLREAVKTAMTPPMGPVSVEIPIDVQGEMVDLPADLSPVAIPVAVPDAAALDALAANLAKARRPLLWLGGGARRATAAVAKLAAMGIGVVTSTQGRGVLPETHPLNLGAFNLHPPVEAFYATCDAMLVVGSRLRSNETLKYTLKLPKPLYRVDTDPLQQGRNYASELFVHGDAKLVLEGLAERLAGKVKIDPAFGADLAKAKAAALEIVRKGLGPYTALLDSITEVAGKDFAWVRDVTLSNSIWGNRLPALAGPHDGVHALGGGIGQGAQMGIGAAMAEAASGRKRKVWCLAGDGGLIMNIGELTSAVQEKADMVLVVMNDRGYGVIRNIQDAFYGSRRCYADLHTPDFAGLCAAIALPHRKLDNLADATRVLREAAALGGPVMVEVDMVKIGPFATAFAGPPLRKTEEKQA